MGSLYRRGNVWWCKYYVNGRPIPKTDPKGSAIEEVLA